MNENKKSNLNPDAPSTASIKVVCRFRPQNEKEKQMHYTEEEANFVNFTSPNSLKINSLSEHNTYDFTFDRIFQTDTTQSEIFETAAKDIVDSVLNGYNGTIFAYGQTSSGKTFTMTGLLDDEEKKGIIPRMAEYVFYQVANADENIEFTIQASMIEIYMEKIRDLIVTSNDNLNIRQNTNKEFYIDKLSEHYVNNEHDIYNLLNTGNDNRAVAFTKMNANSSRSHSIFILSIHQENKETLVKKTGKLYLVDLAGSEKATKTGAEGQVLNEAKAINLSLTNLGMVINALTDGKSKFIPYRQSKLTWILSESLGGNAKTALVITCSPSPYNESETLSTLRFGERAKSIKNKPKVNKELSVEELKRSIERLEKDVKEKDEMIDKMSAIMKEKGISFEEGKEAKVNTEGVIDEKLKEEYEKRIANLKDQLMIKDLERDEIDEEVIELKEKVSLKAQEVEQLEKKFAEFEKKEIEYTKEIDALKKELQLTKEKMITKKGDVLTMGELYKKMKKYVITLLNTNVGEDQKDLEKETKDVLDMIKSISNLDFTLKNDNNSGFSILQIDPHISQFELISKGSFLLSHCDDELLPQTNTSTDKQYLIYEISIRQRNQTIKKLQQEIILLRKQIEKNDSQNDLLSQIVTYQNNFNAITSMNLKLQNTSNIQRNEIQYLKMKNKMKNQKMATFIKEINALKDLLKMRDERLKIYEKNHLKKPQEKAVLRGMKSQDGHYDDSFLKHITIGSTLTLINRSNTKKEVKEEKNE